LPVQASQPVLEVALTKLLLRMVKLNRAAAADRSQAPFFHAPFFDALERR